jgi:hypothetical protein
MSRLDVAASAAEQLRLVRALGLKPLRRRPIGPMADLPAGVCLQVALSPGQTLDALAADRLWLQLLAALGLGTASLTPARAGITLPLLALDAAEAGPVALRLPALDRLRGDTAARRALWPALRRLRRQLGGADSA